MNLFLLGAIATATIVAAVFFLRFWRQTGDRLFLIFAAAFALEALSRIALAATADPSEGQPLIYIVRLISYLLILAAIVDKNVVRR